MAKNQGRDDHDARDDDSDELFPKYIAGVKVPKALRDQGRAAALVAQSPMARELLTAGLAAAAAAVVAAKAEAPEAPWEGDTDPVVAKALASVPKVPDDALDTREALARAARLTAAQVKAIEAIHQNAAPEVVAAVKSGELSLNTAAVLAQLPVDEQKSAAAGGAQELKQAAKRVRDAKKKPKASTQDMPAEGETAAAAPDAQKLQQRVTELEAENERLRQQVKALQDLLAEQG